MRASRPERGVGLSGRRAVEPITEVSTASPWVKGLRRMCVLIPSCSTFLTKDKIRVREFVCFSSSSYGAETSRVGVDAKQPKSPIAMEADLSLPLVKIPAAETNKVVKGVIRASSPDRLELPWKPFHHSNCSDSCISESGSDVYSKREVIQKLRQQLKQRDEMIMEMQAQITDVQNSLHVQMAQTSHLQSQLDSANKDLFTSEREVRQLRKVIADHHVAEVMSPDKLVVAGNWHPESANVLANGYAESHNDLELHHVGVAKGEVDGEKVDMLKREVSELKEVIEGKDFLLQSYKDQKVEFCSKIKELQLKLASQVPNIL
ncbi:hypothetical protein BHE74_00030144 [Ensete ventricosum]|nr:hypothetical protein GW17_00023369 [Ensete ventricosum]RWW62720.1 hypothetical protein BHE74_00030144 [Ensete ventricosum]RZS07588.1 hypothetical protein BHM03_00038472 [Ensete ventricosum]